MSQNGTHLLLVTIFTVILSCLCSIDQRSLGDQEQVARVASPNEVILQVFGDEKPRSGFVPASGRTSYESDVVMEEDKRGSSSFYGARGKKLIFYPFLAYSWKRANMIPMRGRKDSADGFSSSDLISKPQIKIESSYYPEADWKRSLFYGSRGKKDQIMSLPLILPTHAQGRVAEEDATYSWPSYSVIDEDKRIGFYGSRG